MIDKATLALLALAAGTAPPSRIIHGTSNSHNARANLQAWIARLAALPQPDKYALRRLDRLRQQLAALPD